VKTPGSIPDGTAVLLSFVEALRERVESDATLQAACASLRHFGLSPLVRIELVPGCEGPRVMAVESSGCVPQWSERDAELLRSVGIAADPGSNADSDLPQPRRREPR
jgi:hypothetical protein